MKFKRSVFDLVVREFLGDFVLEVFVEWWR